MNAYERRRSKQLEIAADRRSLAQEYKIIDAEKVLRAYEEAFKTLYGRTVKLTFSKGWVTVRNKKVRLSRLQEMAQQLQARIHEQELSNDN